MSGAARMESGRTVAEEAFKAVLTLALEMLTGRVAEEADTAAKTLGFPARKIEKIKEITRRGD